MLCVCNFCTLRLSRAYLAIESSVKTWVCVDEFIDIPCLFIKDLEVDGENLSPYERQRARNIRENQVILKELGLVSIY